MAIDVGIYNQLLRPPKSIAEYDDEAMKSQQNRLALQMQQTQFDDRARAIADGNKLRQVVSGFGADQAANYNSLVSAGRLDEAQKYQKSNADIKKTNADAGHVDAQTQETHLKAVNLKLGQAKDLINTIQTPEQAAAWIDQMYKDPDLSLVFSRSGVTPEQAKQQIPTDPKKFQDWKMQASLGADKLIEYTTPTANTVATNNTSILTNKLTNDTSRANNADTNETTRRGQNMTDARTRESNSASKIPTGYRANKDGSLSFIPGGPADPAAGGGKPATEFQGKSAAFGARAEEADRLLRDLSVKGTDRPGAIKGVAESIPFLGDSLGSVVNSLPTWAGAPNSSQQRVEQAQRDFVNAVLRQESGAAIGASEFENARKQYFPQAGDSDEVKSQKAANRKTAIKGFKMNAGKAAFSADAPSDDVFSAADAILKGGK